MMVNGSGALISYFFPMHFLFLLENNNYYCSSAKLYTHVSCWSLPNWYILTALWTSYYYDIKFYCVHQAAHQKIAWFFVFLTERFDHHCPWVSAFSILTYYYFCNSILVSKIFKLTSIYKQMCVSCAIWMKIGGFI